MNHKSVRALMQDTALSTDKTVSFGYGRPTDFNAIPNKKYPFIWLDPLNATGGLTEGAYNYTKVYNIGLSFFDQDRVDSIQTQYAEILDNMNNLADKFLVRLNNADNIVLLSSISQSPAIKVFADCLTGYTMTFTIQVPDQFNYCAEVPFNGRLCE